MFLTLEIQAAAGIRTGVRRVAGAYGRSPFIERISW
jgi:hypothetical protein